MAIHKVSARWGGAVVLLLGLALLAWACDSGDSSLIGEETPTATPAGLLELTPTSPPGPTPTDTVTPSPTPPGGTETPQPTEAPAITEAPPIDVTDVTPFAITVEEAVNIRAAPSTSGAIVGGIFPGEQKTVVGEARGEAVDPEQGDLWYALEDGGFIYAPLAVTGQE